MGNQGSDSDHVLETRHAYTLHDEIASGGMATIRLGLQLAPHGFSRVVAIKQLHSEYANNQEFVAMFRDEVRVASRVAHPNVVSILDVVSAHAELLLVMQYVHGISVARLMDAAAGPLAPEIATTIVIGVLHGLHAAHEARSERGDRLNVVHRDVTPQNIVVGVDGTPRVLDFGIAHALGRLQTTRIGQVKGKLAYMAPEQFGDALFDRRVDVYSASVVLWEMLAGRRLFGTRRGDRLVRPILRSPIESPTFFQPGISPDLAEIVLRGLQREPEGRYATAREMAVALEERTATVSATQLGDWVRHVWGDDQEARVRQIAAIECTDAPEAPGQEIGNDAGNDLKNDLGHEATVSASEDSVAGTALDGEPTLPGRPQGRAGRGLAADRAGGAAALATPWRAVPGDEGGGDGPAGSESTIDVDVPRDGHLENTPEPQGDLWPTWRGRIPAAVSKRLVPAAAALTFFVLSLFLMPWSRLLGTSVQVGRNVLADGAPPAVEIKPLVTMLSTPRMPSTPLVSTPLVSQSASGAGTSAGTSEGAGHHAGPTETGGVPAVSVAPVSPVFGQHLERKTRRWNSSLARGVGRGGSRPAASRRDSLSPAPASSPSLSMPATKAPPENPAPANAGCEPPFVIDAAGIKRFKVACL